MKEALANKKNSIRIGFKEIELKWLSTHIHTNTHCREHLPKPYHNIMSSLSEMIRDMFLHLDAEGHAGDGRLPQKLAHSLMRSLGIQMMGE